MGVSAGVQNAEWPGIPRFDLPTSGLEWRQSVQPNKFFDATGSRAAVFGRQNGHFEAWIYPIKLLHGFRLEFRQEGMPEPVRGEAWLEQLVVRPESSTIVYVHPRFTVRQTIWIPRDAPAIVQFFDVESDKPLAITAKFTPDFKPMWPASLGGQYSYWLSQEKAFALTDGTSKPTAVIGSPAVGAFTEHMDHALVGGEMLLQLRVEPQQARSRLVPLVMTLSLESAAEARATYASVLGRLRELFEARVAYHRDFLARTLEIETPDAELNRALLWAKVALDAGWVCTPTKFSQGCGLVAGYGPAGESERPGFAWWFGGDALMNAWALLDYGDRAGALQALRFLKARQRADGKMMHEMTQSADLVDWFGKYGFAYYHADTTPLYIHTVAEYFLRSGDRAFLEEFWPSVKKAYEYCLSTVDPADGLMDNTKAGLAAIEVGPLRGKVTKDVYLQGFWLAALASMRLMQQHVRDTSVPDVQPALTKAAESLRSRWWNPQERYIAFGVTREGTRADRMGNWSAVLLALARQRNLEVPREAAEVFSRPELSTDWGSRWLSNRDELYDPLSYNNGSAWPFASGFVAWAQYAHRQPLAAFSTWSSVARLTGLLSPGAVPELMNGDRFLPGERAVPHQLFSSFGVLLPAVRGLLGLEPQDEHLLFAPQLPAQWDRIAFRRYPLAGGRLDGEIRHAPGRLTISLNSDSDANSKIKLAPLLPYGARVRRVLLNGQPAETIRGVTYTREAFAVGIAFELKRQAEIVIEYEGGVGIAAPEPRPAPGDRTASLKVLRADFDPGRNPRELQLALAGLGGRSYALELFTTEKELRAEGAALQKTARGYRLEITFEGSDYVTRDVRLRW